MRLPLGNRALEASKLGQIPYEFVEDIAWGYFYCAFSRSGLVKVELFWEGQKNSEQSLMLLNGIQDKNIVAYFWSKIYKERIDRDTSYTM